MGKKSYNKTERLEEYPLQINLYLNLSQEQNPEQIAIGNAERSAIAIKDSNAVDNPKNSTVAQAKSSAVENSQANSAVDNPEVKRNAVDNPKRFRRKVRSVYSPTK